MGTLQRLLARIAKTLDAANIPHMVIGAQAVLIHGRPRFTGDIDITLGVDVDQLPKLKKITEKLSLKPIPKDFEQFAKQTNVFPVKDQASNIKVDFVFSFSPFEREAVKRAQPIKIEHTNVRYATAEDTIVLKMVAGRPIDISDVKSIVNTQSKLDRNYILKWLKAHSDVVMRDLSREYQEIEYQISQSKGKQ